MATKPTGRIYQIKVTLQDSKPPIWRRLLVKESISLHQLHQIIQVAMGWTDSHLHQFVVNDQYYGIPSPEDWKPVIDERQIRLNQIGLSEKSKFVYEYDFGDGWGHIILVEQIQSSEPGINYPACIKGKGACPPEDVGGIWGYMEFVEAMSNPAHPEHDRYIEWYGGEFDLLKFDNEEVNRALRQVR